MSITTTMNPHQKAALTAVFDDYAINKKKNEALQLAADVGSYGMLGGSALVLAGGIAIAVLTFATMGIGGIALGVLVALGGAIALWKKAAPDHNLIKNAVDLTAGQEPIINRAIDVITNHAPAAPAPYAGFGYAQPVAQVANFAAMNNNNNRQGFLV